MNAVNGHPCLCDACLRARDDELKRVRRADDDILFSAYLGIGILRNMTRAAGLKLAQKRSEELLLEIDAAHPGLAARSALR